MAVIKSTVSKILATFGYQVISTSRITPINLADHLRSLFGVFDIRCVLDVGANIGQYAEFLRKVVGYQHLIISFEPVTVNVNVLRAKAHTDSQWRIFDCALGDYDRELTINVMQETELSSFLTPDTSVTALFSKFNIVDHGQTVKVKTLDSVIESLSLQGSLEKTYLKMDTQGYDLKVMEGGAKALCGIAALQTELTVQPIYEGMPNYLEVLDFLKSKGYVLSGMFPVSQDSLLRLIECDCVMINAACAAKHDVRLMRTPGGV